MFVSRSMQASLRLRAGAPQQYPFKRSCSGVRLGVRGGVVGRRCMRVVAAADDGGARRMPQEFGLVRADVQHWVYEVASVVPGGCFGCRDAVTHPALPSAVHRRQPHQRRPTARCCSTICACNLTCSSQPWRTSCGVSKRRRTRAKPQPPAQPAVPMAPQTAHQSLFTSQCRWLINRLHVVVTEGRN